MKFALKVRGRRILRWAAFATLLISLAWGASLIPKYPTIRGFGELSLSTKAVYAYTPTPQWVDFYGLNSYLSGESLPVNSLVEAYDPDGVLCGKFIVVTEGRYGIMPVYGDDPISLIDEGCEVGDTITFTINGMVATTVPLKGATWTGRTSVPINLELQSLSPISYPVSDDFEKLVIIYNIIEQSRLLHNIQGSSALKDWGKHKESWYKYSEVFGKKLLTLLREQNRLKDKILLANYTRKSWMALSEEERRAASLVMFGDRHQLKLVSTSAVSSVLEDLKTFTLFNVGTLPWVDPLENYTTYTEVDPSGDITVTATKVDVATMVRSVEAYVTKSYGANHFSDFEHLVDVYTGTVEADAGGGVWAVADAYYTESEMNTANNGIRCTLHYYVNLRFYFKDETNSNEDYYEATTATMYYNTVERNGTAGTFKLYSDAARTTLVDTLSITAGTQAYEYIHAVYSEETAGSAVASYYVENLDLQEAVADISNTPSSKAFGVVASSTSYWSDGAAPTWPLDDAECFFTVTNNGAVCSITVQATNFTGGVGWTLGVPAENVARMKTGKSGDALEANMVTLTTAPQAFISALANLATKKWEAKLETPTSFTDGVEKSSTITLTATLD